MVLQSDAVYEVEVGIEDLLGSVSRQNPEKKGYYAFDYQCVGIGFEIDVSIRVFVGCDPYAALATFDQVRRSFFRIRQRRKREGRIKKPERNLSA